MITNVNKKIICVKDIPSNIIEEAIFILKTDLNNSSKEKINIKKKEIAKKEAENFLTEYIKEIQLNEDEKKSEKYFKNIKIKAVLYSIIGVLIFYTISLLFI